MDVELCPTCQREFPLMELLEHAPTCNGDAPSSDHSMESLEDPDIALARRLWEEEQAEAKRPRTGDGPELPPRHTQQVVDLSGAAAAAPEEDEDPSLALARQLQAEEDAARSAVQCAICSQDVNIDLMYILDECSHKFDKLCLADYTRRGISREVAVKCPVAGCEAALSVRDVKELLGEGVVGSADGQQQQKPRQQTRGMNEHTELLGGMIPTKGTAEATERLLAEMKHIMASDPETNGYKVKPIKDNLYHWEVKLFGFDKTENLAKDLSRHKHKQVVLHCVFPQSYPFAPPYVRVIRPRFQFRTGHVTLGGSICMEMLTNMGWSPANTIEAIIVSIRAQLIAGGARLDSSNTRDYSTQEAKEAFDRMMSTHGWSAGVATVFCCL